MLQRERSRTRPQAVDSLRQRDSSRGSSKRLAVQQSANSVAPAREHDTVSRRDNPRSFWASGKNEVNGPLAGYQQFSNDV
jgi:hypothetical protein